MKSAARHWLRRAFTLIELLTVIAVIMILVSLLLPALKAVRVQAKKTACLGNLRQIGLLVNGYAEENGQWLPMAWPRFSESYAYAQHSGFAYDLQDGIPSYPTLARTVFDCPELTADRYGDPRRVQVNEYAWNFYFMGHQEGVSGSVPRQSLVKFKKTSENLCVAERSDGSANNDQDWKYTTYYYTGNYRHGQRSNLLFLDGHTGDRPWQDLYFAQYDYASNPEKAKLWGHPSY